MLSSCLHTVPTAALHSDSWVGEEEGVVSVLACRASTTDYRGYTQSQRGSNSPAAKEGQHTHTADVVLRLVTNECGD